jgi:hypothetical protein
MALYSAAPELSFSGMDGHSVGSYACVCVLGAGEWVKENSLHCPLDVA